jgi:hypothetical protein
MMTDTASGKLIVNSNREIADVALIECIRILDLLCKFDPSLVCYRRSSVANSFVVREKRATLAFLICFFLKSTRLFPTMKKLFSITKARTIPENELSPQSAKVLTLPDKYGGHINLTLLQFFLNHSETVIYDPEPLFQNFFENFVSSNCIYSTF